MRLGSTTIYLSICESNWTYDARRAPTNGWIIHRLHQVQMGRALQEWEHLAAHFLWAAMVHFLAHTSRFRWQSLLVTHLAGSGGGGFFVDVAPPLGFSFSFSLFPLSSLLSFFSAPPPAAGEGDDDGEDDPLLLVVVTTSSSFLRVATAAMVFALISASAEAQAPTAARRMTTRSSSEASASRLLEQAMVAYVCVPPYVHLHP